MCVPVGKELRSHGSDIFIKIQPVIELGWLADSYQTAVQSRTSRLSTSVSEVRFGLLQLPFAVDFATDEDERIVFGWSTGDENAVRTLPMHYADSWVSQITNVSFWTF